MVKTFDLVKIFLREMYKFNNRTTNKRKNNSKGLLILLIVLVPIYLLMFVSNFIQIFTSLGNGVVDVFDKSIYTIVVLVTISSLFFIVISGNQMVMTEKDNDVLGTLPIPERTIISAKLITAMIVESFFEIFIGISGLIAYIVVGNITLNGLLVLLIAPILSIVLPTVLFSFLILAVRKAIQKSKYKRVLELLGLVLMIVFIFGLSFMISMTTSAGEMDNPNILTGMMNVYETFMTYFPGLILIKLSIEQNNILFFILYVVLMIGLFAVFTVLFQKFAFRMMVYEKINNQQNKKDKIEYKNSTIFKTLLKKEFTKLFNDNLYIVNALLLPVFAVIGAILIAVFKNDMIMEVDGETAFNFTILIFPIILVILSMMTLTSSFTLSLENKCTWFLRTLPIDEKTIFKAKAAFNLILYYVPGIIIYILYIITVLPNFLEAFGTLCLMVGSSTLTTYLNQFINLRHPAIDMEDKYVIKQSTSVMIASFLIIGEMFLFPGLIVGMYFATSSFGIGFIVAGVILFLFGLLFIYLINKNGKKLYKRFC